jgi:hypothetical protein
MNGPWPKWTKKRTNSFLSRQIGNEAKVGTWAEVLLGLVKDLLFAFHVSVSKLLGQMPHFEPI